ncbi:hypothetical protein SAMN04488134_108103 [Amphibacillus marinus]|uniref:Uncharacterized protein n=1 Tax=Amphibacillus marinus TaxID=872970 RepID=A0A1H8QBR7_9BACI|nr:hypothetical protein [Amphibacillus marinus]SEO51364.1 hypothetical protein SAMN04488134_108103 [Amphibacillus marinus]
MNHAQLIKNLDIIGKHLTKHEYYFRKPEQKVLPYIDLLEKDMQDFAAAFELFD